MYPIVRIRKLLSATTLAATSLTTSRMHVFGKVDKSRAFTQHFDITSILGISLVKFPLFFYTYQRTSLLAFARLAKTSAVFLYLYNLLTAASGVKEKKESALN